MALTVATNTGALMAQAAASSVNKEMEVSMERLSSGKRINSAADDAAGVAIASRLTSEIRGTNQAIRNARRARYRIIFQIRNDGYRPSLLASFLVDCN